MQTCNNNETNVSETLCKDRELLHNRLIEARLSPNRFHGLRPKTKMNSEKESLIKRLQEANLSTRRFLKVNECKRAYEKD